MAEEQPLEQIEINPEGEAQASLIWLHGLGADGHDFEPLFRHLAANLPSGLRIILPHAPVRSVTINLGLSMRAWYDLHSTSLSEGTDLDDLRSSTAQLNTLLAREEERGVPHWRLCIGGFSQGSVTALWTGLGYPRRLAGIAALSAYLPTDPAVASVQRTTPIFMGHGENDSLIPRTLGTAARDRLAELGCQSPEWHTYAVDHGVNEQEAKELIAWLNRILQAGP